MNQETAQNRKKVLFVVTKSNFGGAQRYVYDLATNLPRDIYEPVVVAGPGQGTDVPGALLEHLESAGIRTIFIPEMARDVSLADWRAFRALYRVIGEERPHAIHLNSSKAGALGALAARLRGVPRVLFTVHGWAFRESRHLLSRLLIYKISAITVLLCHGVICISDDDARPFVRFPLLRNKIRLIRNAIREPAMLDRAESRQKLVGNAVAHGQDIWIGSVGELTHNKNIKTALDALALALRSDQKLFYVIVGDGEQREKLASYAHRRNLDGHVHFAGQVPEAARLLSAFDIFLLPSRKEGLPYVLLEAAAGRIAVVAAAVGGIPELVENGVSGALCQPDDTMGMADALTELARDPALRSRFADALKATTLREHDFTKMLRETIAQY